MALMFSLTGLHLPYDENQHANDLFLFFKKYDEHDFILVIKHLKKRYAQKQEILLQMCKFRYLIQRLDNFAELLAEAKAVAPRRPTERDKTLMATGRPAESQEAAMARPAKPAGEVLRRMSKEQLAQGWAAVKAALDNPESDNHEQEDPASEQPVDNDPPSEQLGFVPEYSSELTPENNFGIEIEEEGAQCPVEPEPPQLEAPEEPPDLPPAA